MVGIRPLLLAGTPLLVSFLAHATEVPVSFGIIDGEQTTTINYSGGDTSEQTARHTGTIDAVLSFDPASERVTKIRFKGGNVAETPMAFKNTVDIYAPGGGSRTVIFEVITSGIHMRLNTVGDSHIVRSDGGILDPFSLQSVPFEGIVTAKITVDGRTESQQVDAAINPPNFGGPAYGTSLWLRLSETANRGGESDYDITLFTSIRLTKRRNLPDGSTLTETKKGLTMAKATFTAPNAFGQWLLDSGYNQNDANSTDSLGCPLALLYAFQLPVNAHQGLPWGFSHDTSGDLVLSLQLPSNGLQQAIRIEACHDLTAADWQPLTASDFLDGQAKLERGSSGARRIRFPNTGPLFYRIVPAATSN